MKKLVFIIPLAILVTKVTLSLMYSVLVSFLRWISPVIFVICVGNYITRTVMNSSTESVTPSSQVKVTKKEPVKLSARQIRRRKQKERRLGLGKSNDLTDNLNSENSIAISTDITNLNEIRSIENTDIKTIDNINASLYLNKLSAVNYIHSLNKDKNVTKIFSLSREMTKFYVINETVFSDNIIMMDEEFCDYRLYKVKTDKSGDVHGAEDELTEDDLTEPLFLTAQRTKHGVILNNNVYLTNEKWNAILPLNTEIYSCAVCQLQCDGLTVSGHIESASHAHNLSAHRPLKKFDLSIIRKINDNLHCGVCNAIFHISSYREHENSKSHEENLLFSINKVSDMFEDDDKKSTQNFNASNIQAPNNAPCSRSDSICIWPGNFWPESINIESDSESRLRNESESCDEISESDGICNVVDSGNIENFFGRNVYKNIRIYEEDEIQEYNLPIEGVSYASMASKPKLDVPKFLKIDLGTKEVRVKFEYWHMITPTNQKELYCMVCRVSFLARHKRAHCLDDGHITTLASCNVVDVFEDYLIRNVSDKLYHCGHCNNLQYKNDMQIHIEKYHPLDPKNRHLKLPSTEESKIKINQEIKVENPVKRIKKLDIFGHFKFSPFGVDMTVSNFACHTIMMVVNSYYCAICDVFVQGELIEHVYEMKHMQLINMTPFIKPFQCNLTRAVRGSLHCAICNQLVPVEGIEDHNISTLHTDQLAHALGMVKKERPKHEVKYHREEPREFKTDLNKFLATLPPDTRGVLSRLKVKNHKGEMFELSDTSSGTTDTPESISLNNSPIHARTDYTPTGVPNKIQDEPTSTYPGVNTVSHPKKALDPIHPGQVNGGVTYPQGGVEGITPKGVNFKQGQMIPLSVIESSLGVRTKDRVDDITIRRPEDLVIADGLLSLYNHRVQSYRQLDNEEKCTEVKTKDIGKTREKTTETDKKSETESDEEEPPFVPEEIVLLKFKSTYFKVTASAYHSLVPIGSGARHCFVCSSRLTLAASGEHVRSRAHTDTIQANKFLHNFCGQLFRQMYRMYHCAICNVTMSRKEVRMHLEWPPHIERYDAASSKLSKKVLKDTLKHAKEVCVETQKEFVHAHAPDPPHIVSYIQSTRTDCVEAGIQHNLDKKAQIIILEGNMMKISFDSWHGVLVTKGGIKCIICQQELTPEELQPHLETKYHSVALGITFDKQYYPALVRKINANTANCVICNLELMNDESLIFEHICGRKHVKNYQTIIEKTSHTDSYSDCYKFPISL